MKINTRVFGEVEVSDDKIIVFENGIIGFPDMKKFTMLHDEEKGADAGIRFLQSLDEPSFAMPVMDPLVVREDYNPQVDEDLIKGIGDLNEENLLILVTVTVPQDLTKMTVNLQGPIIINVDTMKAAQVIIEGDNYSVRFPVYDILKSGQEVKE
ncbi:MAG: flagellar assembly protein FliW [Lachnospiraceae bacterium]|nr:flagellar assembly protein FliW [Lachnospiraceae bacterium]